MTERDPAPGPQHHCNDPRCNAGGIDPFENLVQYFAGLQGAQRRKRWTEFKRKHTDDLNGRMAARVREIMGRTV